MSKNQNKKNFHLIKFNDRDPSSYYADKCILEMLNAKESFDVQLVGSNKKHVSAHRFVLMMFSKYLNVALEDRMYSTQSTYRCK